MTAWVKQRFERKYFKSLTEWTKINYIDWSKQQLWPVDTHNMWINTNGLELNKWYFVCIQITSANNYEPIWVRKTSDTKVDLCWTTNSDKGPDDYITGVTICSIDSHGWANAKHGAGYIYRFVANGNGCYGIPTDKTPY